MTDNHGYNTPSAGSSDWDVPLNENFTDLDGDVEIRDVETNRSNYAPKDGAKYLATDTGRVYLGDGSSWNELGTISSGDFVGAPTIGGTTGRSDLFATRPLVSTQDRSYDVPGDYDTIQAALADVPMFLKHRYTIALDSSQFYDEDIIVPPVWCQDFNHDPYGTGQRGQNSSLAIFGQNHAQVGSAFVINPIGYPGVRIDGVDFQRHTPYSDDKAACAVYGGAGTAFITDCITTEPLTQGIIAYGPRIVVRSCEARADCNYFLRAKAGAYIYARNVTNPYGNTYAVSGGMIDANESDAAAGNTGIARGMVLDGDNAEIVTSGGVIS